MMLCSGYNFEGLPQRGVNLLPKRWQIPNLCSKLTPTTPIYASSDRQELVSVVLRAIAGEGYFSFVVHFGVSVEAGPPARPGVP